MDNHRSSAVEDGYSFYPDDGMAILVMTNCSIWRVDSSFKPHGHQREDATTKLKRAACMIYSYLILIDV
ncbi:hypothetical protein PTKIN_Ptkin06aG0160300 [Pterospermum kingtungense]